MIRFAQGCGVGAAALIVTLTGLLAAAAPVQAQGYYQPKDDPYLVIQAPGAAAPVYTGPTYTAAPYPTTSTVRATSNGQPVTYAERPIASSPPPPRTLATQSGIQLGLQGSYYDYKEKGEGVELEGGKFGINPIGTLALGQFAFVTADLRYALGNADYSGSGHSSGNFEDLLDLRGLVGHDFLFSPYVSASPYIGFGYRRLYSDERGTTNDGFSGYQRTNQLYYLPIGVTPRIRLDDQSRLALTLEGDVVLHGNQESDLNDVSPIYPRINNGQNSGYGLRGDLNYETGNWALGPFVTYWHLDNSVTSCGQTFAGVTCAFEPDNQTLEAGFQIRYRLL